MFFGHSLQKKHTSVFVGLWPTGMRSLVLKKVMFFATLQREDR